MTTPPPRMRRRLLGGSAIAAAGAGTLYLSGLVTNVLVARLLPPKEAGAYFLAQSVATSTVYIAQLGLATAAIRLVADSIARGELGRARDSVRLVLRAGWIAVAIGLVFVFAPTGRVVDALFPSTQLGRFMPLIAALLVARTLTHHRANTFRGFHEIGRATLFSQIAGPGLTAAALVALWVVAREDATVRIILGISAAAWVPGLVAASVLLRFKLKSLHGPGSATPRDLARLSIPLTMSSLCGLALQQGHFLIVGARLAATEIARYGAAMRLSNLLNTTLQIVAVVTTPIIAELHAQGKIKELERVMRTTSSGALAFTLPPAVLFMIFGRTVLRVVYGPFYAGAASILAVMCIGQIVTVAAGQGASVLNMTGHERANLMCNFVAGTFTIVCCLLFVGPFGAMGGAVSWAAGIILLNVVQVGSARRLVGVWTQAGIGRSLDEAGILLRRFRQGRGR
jgi:O-antigen/teichoic acid export membrane protein